MVRVRATISRIKECNLIPKQDVKHLAELLDVQHNPQAYRICQETAAEDGADDLLLALLAKSEHDSERTILWEAIAVLSFNYADLQRRTVANEIFRQCLRQDLGAGRGSYCMLKLLAAEQALMSVAPCFDSHNLLAPMLPSVIRLAVGTWPKPECKAVRLLAVEVLVNITANPQVRPIVAASFSSNALRNLVDLVKTSGRKEDQFALALLLANLGSHPTEDGRGCLGSALDWVPFKDFNIFDDIAGALDAALRKCDWPPGSYAFHSLHRLASLVSALASVPLMQTLYSAELATLVQPMMRVVKASVLDETVAGIACIALKDLARFPNNFGIISGDLALTNLLIELRDEDGLREAGQLIDHLHEYRDKIVISGGGILWRSTELLAHVAKQVSTAEWRMPHCKFEVVRDHVRIHVTDLYDEVGVSTHRCSEILNVLPHLPANAVSKAMALWTDARFSDVVDVERRLSTIVDYCEGDHCHAAGHRSKAPDSTVQKLRMVVQLMHEDESESKSATKSKLPILLLLAAHGGVCNVQKEVGIDAAYAQLTRTCAKHAEKTSFKTCVLRLLCEIRERIVEQMAVESCIGQLGFTNTHFLAPFRNLLAESVGIREIPDPNGHPMNNVDIDGHRFRFWDLYSLDTIVAEVRAALNDVPRRIPYDSFILWMKENAPPGQDAYSFLAGSFDINGNVLPTAVHYALCRLGVLRSATEFSQWGSELMVHRGAQVWHGLNAYTTLAQMWNFPSDSEKCHMIVEKVYEAIRCVDDEDEALESFGNFRLVLERFEDDVAPDPSSSSCAQDWLIAGALMNKKLSSPAWNRFWKEFPRVATLLKQARRCLKQN